ncbi:MAG: nucleotidyltransferase [Gemmatimonadales bacterium]|nr:MAG: nucleotidyltransferase [Gemmatimonadales bacterium]
MHGRVHDLSGEERRQLAERLAAALAGTPGVAFAYLHGSILDSLPVHDVDVAVYLNPFLPERATATTLELSQELSEQVGIPVDVRALNQAPLSFVYHALRGQLLCCQDEALLAEVIERTVPRYLDSAPLLRQAAIEAFAA